MAERSVGPVPRVLRAPDDPRLARYALHGDPHDLEALVLRYRPLALSLARRYAGPLQAMDDLAQVACLGLIKALQRFEPQRGCPFVAYAVPTILGELRRFCRDSNSSVHVPRGMQERIVAVRRARDTATAARGRTVTVADLADELGCDCDSVAEALVAGSVQATVPLDREMGDAEDPSHLIDLVGDVDPGFERVEALAALEGSVGALTRDEQRVLRLRFGEDLSLRDVAARLSLSETQVSRLLASALRTLRQELGVDREDEPAIVPFGAPRRDRREFVEELTGIAA